MDPGDPHGSLQEERYSFVQLIFPRKTLAAPPAGVPIAIRKGAHVIEYEGKTALHWRRVACLHLPLRAASELDKRVRDYKDCHAPTIENDRLVRYLRRADLFMKAMRWPGAKHWAMPARALLKPRFASVKTAAGVDLRPPQGS